jgi:hypothetical protein
VGAQSEGARTSIAATAAAFELNCTNPNEACIDTSKTWPYLPLRETWRDGVRQTRMGSTQHFNRQAAAAAAAVAVVVVAAVVVAVVIVLAVAVAVGEAMVTEVVVMITLVVGQRRQLESSGSGSSGGVGMVQNRCCEARGANALAEPFLHLLLRHPLRREIPDKQSSVGRRARIALARRWWASLSLALVASTVTTSTT